MATDPKLSDAEYAAALQQVRDFRKQLAESQQLADQGSLDVAHALAAIFADGRWADDLPPVKRSHLRGRPVDPYGRSRFATWARDPQRTGGWAPSTVYQFLNAARIASEFFPRAETNQVTEFVLRPLGSLLAKGQTDLIPQAWDKAKRQAHGTPSSEQVKAAVAELRPKPVTGRSATASAPTDWSAVIFAEFESHFLKPHRLRDAGMLLIRMKDAYDKARTEDGD